MKKLSVFTLVLLLVSYTQAQINVRLKKTPDTKEIDIKTNSKHAASPDKKQATTDTKEKPVLKKDSTASVATTPADEAYNGPAKVQLKSLMRYMQKLRAGDILPSTLSNAERMLEQVKQADASYNISGYEKEIAVYRQNANKESQSVADSKSVAEAEGNYFKNLHQKIIGIYSTGINIEPGVTGKVYLERVKAINLAEYNQKKATVTGVEAKKFVERIDQMLADYDDYLKRSDRLRWNVTELMLKSRSKQNQQEKMNLLETAKYECEAVLLISPANAAFKQKLEEVNKLLGSANAEASINFTSDFHKEHVGQIVWSSKPLIIGKEKEMAAQIKTEFKSGESVFGVVYLGNKVNQLMNGNQRLRVIIKVDGGTAIWGGDMSYLIVPLAVQDKSYFQFALLPDEDWFAKNYAPYVADENWTYSYLMDELVRAGDISHNITCELDFPSTIQGNIKSSFTLDLSNSITQIKTLSTKLHEQLMASRSLPKAGMNNAALEQQMLTAANKLGWKNIFLKAVITSSSWSISKNELTGAILYRYVSAVCTTKEYDGKCYYQEFTFRQDYTGGGNYSNTIKYNSYGSKREIGCDKIK